MRIRIAFLVAPVALLALALPAAAQNSSSFTSSGGSSSGGSSSGGNSSSSSGGGSAQQTGGSSSAVMNGDTNTSVDQNVNVESGPASAGSQIVGVQGTPKPKDSDGAGGGTGTVTPGESSSGSDSSSGSGNFNEIQTPAPHSTSVQGVTVKSSRSTGDVAASAVVAAFMLLGVVFLVWKLPRPTA